jgi:adenylate cyclase
MKKIRKETRKKIVALSFIVLIFAAVSLLHLSGVFNYLEYKSYDLRVKLFAFSSRPSDDIIVILLDQASIDWAQRERGWGWPWPRRAYAEMLDYISLGGANSVAFDIFFSEPSIYQAEDDEAFSRAAREYGRVVQGVFFSSRTGNARSWPPELNVPLFEPAGFGPFLDQFNTGEGGNSLDGAQLPIKELRDTAAALGALTGIPDSDGIIRRMRLFTYFDGKALPGLGPALLFASGDTPGINLDSKSSSIRWGNFVIPVDKNGASLLRFRGDQPRFRGDQSRFRNDLSRYIPFAAKDVLMSAEAYRRGEELIYPPDEFTGCYVFVGVYAPGLFDIFSTPISSSYPGMGGHITMLDNILQGDFIRESRQWLNLLILFAAVSLTVMVCLFSNRVLLPVGATVLTAAAVIAAAFIAYDRGNLWLPILAPSAGIAAAFIGVTLYNYATEGSQKRFIKSAFSQYLSPKVIDQIIADPSQLKLGGEKREMTAIFTDVRSFSTISEALGDPQKLVELLNHYLTRMSNIVLDNQGTIDKYEGDAIIAFFGAPVHLDNHAALACRSAVMMKKAEAGINREALELGLITGAVMEAMVKKGILKSLDDPCPMFTRLGINTGDMVVGNMGTPSKMDYTIMGNAVNLAARLEGVNKQYNTGGILLSEYTRDHIGDEFVVRPLSRVRVVGINTPLRLYELLDIRQDAPPQLLEMVKNWEQGFTLYEQKDFSAASDIFQSIYHQNEFDFAAKKYFDRCQKYLASPPDDSSWDSGIDNLTEK